MTTNNIDKMIEFSSQKKNLLMEIFELTKAQANFIEEDNMEEIDIILEKKEELMNKIDIFDKEFLENYLIVKKQEGIDSIDMIDIRKYDNLKFLKNIVNDINTILSEIEKIDKKNILNMQSNISNIKSNLRQVKEVKRAYKGYYYEPNESILIDKKK